ncbi:unnamed protein product [Thelazia callipaeda]|uniref:BLVR domain-containing protein n=1 Tax=Thelazia callipaeda TaxID=103827 RepID=A0A0N5CLV3_THECL|nr:unnamed protein product [Thelazia callipaeda]
MKKEHIEGQKKISFKECGGSSECYDDEENDKSNVAHEEQKSQLGQHQLKVITYTASEKKNQSAKELWKNDKVKELINSKITVVSKQNKMKENEGKSKSLFVNKVSLGKQNGSKTAHETLTNVLVKTSERSSIKVELDPSRTLSSTVGSDLIKVKEHKNFTTKVIPTNKTFEKNSPKVNKTKIDDKAGKSSKGKETKTVGKVEHKNQSSKGRKRPAADSITASQYTARPQSETPTMPDDSI